MPTAQHGIFAQGTRSHYHLELDLRPGADLAAVKTAMAGLREPAVTAGGTNIVVGAGPDLWTRLAPDGAPNDLDPFQTLVGSGGRTAEASQHDLWVWSHGTGDDLQLDVARAVAAAFLPVATVAYEQSCFVYRDSRDLTGFVDGTENPPMEEAHDVAVVPDGEPGAGGSHAILMRWVHDLAAFHAQSIDDQEQVFGRTKPDSLERDDKPASAHISRVVIEEDGEELEIYRRSTPYGTVAEHGLQFVAFSAERSRFDKMLLRMYGLTGDGVHDRLLDFSQATRAAFYFVPSIEALNACLA